MVSILQHCRYFSTFLYAGLILLPPCFLCICMTHESVKTLLCVNKTIYIYLNNTTLEWYDDISRVGIMFIADI